MVMIYDKLDADPRITRLPDPAFVVWMRCVSRCSELRRDVLGYDELRAILPESRWPDLDGWLVELDRSDLVKPDLLVSSAPLRFQFLARLDLWAFEDEVPPEHIA